MPHHALRPPTEVLTRGFDPTLSVGSARPVVFRSSTYVFSGREAALAQALADRLIAAAGLDVSESEPHVRPLFLELENVVLAPHIGSASIDTRRKSPCWPPPPSFLNPEAIGH